MELRRFIISLVSKYDDSGFKQADRSTKRLKKDVDKLTKSYTRLSASQTKAAASTRKLSAAQAGLADDVDDANKELEDQADGADKADKGTSALSSTIGVLGRVAAVGTAAITGLATATFALGKSVIEQGSAFESLQARLDNLLGSAELGKGAFDFIQDFTKNTPFQLEQVTESFTKLQGRGIAPTERRLTAFGDLASSTGKSLDDITEAVLDATQGEGERLKEFGIRMSKNGDRVSLSFRGITQEVKLNEQAIADALTGFGEMEGVADTMSSQMATTSGRISNLKDSFALMFNEVAQMGVLDEFNLLLTDVSGLAGEDGLAQTLADVLVNAIKALRQALQDITAEDMERWLNGIAAAGDLVARSIELASMAIQQLLEFAQAVQLLANDFGLLSDEVGEGASAFELMGQAIAGIANPANTLYEIMLSVVSAMAEAVGLGKQFQSFLNSLTGLRARAEKAAGLGAGTGQDVTAGLRAARAITGESAFLGGGKSTINRSAELAQAQQSGDTSKLDAIAANATISDADRAFAAQASENVRAQQRDRAEQERFAQAQERRQFEAALGGAAGGGRGSAGSKGKRGKEFFDFRKKAQQEARKQGEAFAAQQLQDLRREGVAVDDALTQAKAAGKERAKDLEQRFLEAGRIFDASANNILDVLGLRGPGSVLEGRPPPQTLIISPQIEINLVKQFNQTIEGVTGAAALEEVTGQGAETAVEAGLGPNRKFVEEIATMVYTLQIERLMKLGAGGSQPRGPEQG